MKSESLATPAVQNPTEEKIKLSEKIGYGLGDTASVLYFHTFSQFLLIFYTDVYGLSAAAVGTLFLVTRVIDAVNDPLMGMIADRTRSKHGKFRPWLRWMVVPYMALGVLTFTVPDFGDTGKLIYAYITYTLVGTVYTAINIPYGALMGVMTPHSEARTELASFRFYGAYLAVNLVNLSMLYLVSVFGGGDEAAGYQRAIMLYALVAGALFMVVFYTTKERVKTPKDQKSDLKEDLKDLVKNRPWLAICGIGILTLIWISLRNAAILYFMEYYVGATKALTTSFLFWGGIATMVGVYFTKHSERYLGGKKRAYIILTLAVAVVTTPFYVVSPENTAAIFAIHIAGSLLSGPLMPLFWSMIADTADYAEWKFGRRFTGLIFSAGTFSQKTGWALGSAFGGYTLAYFGYVANVEQTPDSIIGIKLLMSFGPAVLGGIAAIVTLFYGINPQLAAKIETELKERHKT